MVNMPKDVRETLEKQKPIPIATANKAGVPNVVFVGLVRILDDETLMIVDNFFNKTAANLAENPKVSILCYNPETSKSFQIKGSAKIHKEGQIYEDMRNFVHSINDKLPVKAAVVVKIEEIFDALYGPGAGAKIA
jgi:predicted pyridoxine 5'-phosphate oxidase superfamily flavin-nucleotide-binding protein